jgi:hypothetical protein
MAVSAPRPQTGCNGHRPYRSKAEATWRASWHLTCAKCARGLVMRAWPHEQHWHVGHGRPWLPPRWPAG